MIPRTALTQLAKLLADDLSEGHVGGELRNIGEALASAPGSILDLLDLMAKEARKKRPNQALLDAFAFMLGQSLEVLRYGVESNATEAVEAVSAARAHVRSLALEGKLDTDILLLMLRQFTGAKLELGDDLQEVMAGLLDQEQVSALPGAVEIGEVLADMARACGGDVFALYAELAEQTSALPESHRAGIVAALLAAPDPSLREAAIGWLLDPGAAARRDTAGLLQQAAAAGHVSATMLRRMIAIRNWLPDDERPAVDAVIRACRQNGVDCAPSAAALVRDVLATAIDGSGAQSLFLMVKDGRRQAVAALLLKRGIGVRDAWVNGGLGKADADMFLFQVETQTDCYDGDIDHVRLLLGHALAEAGKSGVLPPFGLVDVIERAGLTTVNPEAITLDSLLAGLLADIPAERRTPAMVAGAINASAAWEDYFPFMDSWFEDDGAIAELLNGKRMSAKGRVALLLDKYLPARRARWAELLAWTALTLRQDESTEEDWMNFALVAHEILGDRPLADIPVMTKIAGKTVEAWQSRR
ncbi:hypothetical protein [Telmatospirillum siberiense]|nr:hypothetical protein [Telmatospirillum siberiense]